MNQQRPSQKSFLDVSDRSVNYSDAYVASNQSEQRAGISNYANDRFTGSREVLMSNRGKGEVKK